MYKRQLLFWNGDSTNLPAKMSVQYLRNLCQMDKFARGELKMFGENLSLKDVDLPLCAIACETDHIAAWKASYAGIQKMGSKQKTFVLSESGHIAGIVNPPTKQKYGHYLNYDMSLIPELWLEGAEYTAGSWWPYWGAWLKRRSGKQIPARKVGTDRYPVLAKAPGTYVIAAE